MSESERKTEAEVIKLRQYANPQLGGRMPQEIRGAILAVCRRMEELERFVREDDKQVGETAEENHRLMQRAEAAEAKLRGVDHALEEAHVAPINENRMAAILALYVAKNGAEAKLAEAQAEMQQIRTDAYCQLLARWRAKL